MTGRRSNREILTGGKKYVQKQNKKYGVDEVSFDRDSRVNYLTGFHKRKVQRQKKAQDFHKEQDRLARIAERKRIRDERKQDLEDQLLKFNETVNKITNYDSESEEEESWTGFSSDVDSKQQKDEADDEDEEEDTEKPKPSNKGILKRKEVYIVEDPTEFTNTDAVIDEDTTVTVESIDNPLMSNIQQISLEAKAKANYVDLSKADQVLAASVKRAQNYAVTAGVAKPKGKKPKTKKFRYLTKTERRDNNMKQKVRKLKSRKHALEK